MKRYGNASDSLAIGAGLTEAGNVIDALRKPEKQEIDKRDPFKSPLSPGSYWFGGGQLRGTTGDVIGQERNLRGRLGDLAKTVTRGSASSAKR